MRGRVRSALFQIAQDARMDDLAQALFFLADAGEQLAAQLQGDALDLLDQRAGLVRQHHLLGAAILGHGDASYQLLSLKAVEQPGQGRTLDAHGLRQLALGRRVLEQGQVEKDQPARLGQAEAGETTVQLGAPGAGKLGQLHAETVVRETMHRRLSSGLATAHSPWTAEKSNY